MGMSGMVNYAAAPRALMPDYLRLAALFGIAVVNVQFMAFSALGDFARRAGEGLRDALTMWLVNGLALLKTFGLFSFRFGVGLGLMMPSAERRGLSFGRIHRNRMIGLLILGVAHGCPFFRGDILTVYMLTGGSLSAPGLDDWRPCPGRRGAPDRAGLCRAPLAACGARSLCRGPEA